MTDRRIADVAAELLAVEAELAGIEAQKKALRAELADRAAAVHKSEGAAPSWKMPALGSVTWCVPTERPVVVADPPALLAWAEVSRPEAIERAVASWLVNELAKTSTALPDGSLVTPDGEQVPGLLLGPPKNPYLAVRIDAEAKARAAAAVARPPADQHDPDDDDELGAVPPSWANDPTAAEFLAGDTW
jgi:hypothetical protein